MSAFVADIISGASVLGALFDSDSEGSNQNQPEKRKLKPAGCDSEIVSFWASLFKFLLELFSSVSDSTSSSSSLS
jgi:hypothetical protein